MWPARADDFTLWTRRSLEQTESTTLPKYARSHPGAASNSSSTCARCSTTSTSCSCPTTAVPAFAAEGPPPSVIAGVDTGNACDGDAVHDAGQPVLEPGDLDARAASRPTACPSASRSSPAAIATRSRCASPASSSRPTPGPASRQPRRTSCRRVGTDVARAIGSCRTVRGGSARLRRSRSPVRLSSACRPLLRRRLLEPGDVRGSVVVLGDELVDLALVRGRRDLEVGRRHRRAEERRRAARSSASAALGDGALGT